MNKANLGIVCAIVVAVAALYWSFKQQSKLYGENQLFRQKLSELTADNSRLTNLVARAEETRVLFARQTADLLRLRQQVEALRVQTNELARLRESLRDLENEGLGATTNAKDVLSNQAEPATVPKELWSFVGYGTPAAAIESTLWALDRGEARTFLAGCAPDLAQQLTREWGGLSDSDLAAAARDQVSRINGYRIVDQLPISDSEVVVMVYGAGSGNISSMRLLRVGDDWKYAGVVGN